ncbi:MAG: hypothetical protein NT028_10085 [candidate division Zixibacteria bacterium]|nr:hypothetical protein [candidate division Zixibacteria bacterium]
MELKEGSRAVVAVDLLKTKEGKSKAEIDYQRRLTFLRPQEGSTAEPIDRSTYRIGSKTAADIANVIAVSYAENVADTSADDKNGASS